MDLVSQTLCSVTGPYIFLTDSSVSIVTMTRLQARCPRKCSPLSESERHLSLLRSIHIGSGATQAVIQLVRGMGWGSLPRGTVVRAWSWSFIPIQCL